MFMHHHPLESQGVYTTPTPKQVMVDLAAERLYRWRTLTIQFRLRGWLWARQ
jgi:hypothetical protein